MTGYADVKEWRKNTKVKLFEAFSKKCACCGLEDHPIVYDFHHIDPTTKDFIISSGSNSSWKRIDNEAKKCMMVCVICHRKLHAGLIEIPATFPKFDEGLITSIKERYNVGLHNKTKRKQSLTIT